MLIILIIKMFPFCYRFYIGYLLEEQQLHVSLSEGINLFIGKLYNYTVN